MLLEILEPGEEKHAPAVGIDLGTTHSLIAVCKDRKVTIIPDENGSVTLPSVVAYIGPNVVVGAEAVELQKSQPENVVSSAKRLMGQGMAEAHNFIQHSSVEISGTEEVIYFNPSTKKLTAVEVSADILKALKFQAEKALGENVYDAVITVPAYFNDAQRQATKDAARLAGLNVLRLVNEPTAAALAYGLDKTTTCLNTNNSNKAFMVYDFGGGTFDVSILKYSEGVFRVISTAGNTYLGGDDIDNTIAKKLNISALEARQIKEQLSDNTTNYSNEKLTITELNKLAEPFIQQTLTICNQALNDAELEADDLGGIVLVGGSTRMPLVQKMVADEFNKTPETGLNPDEVVAYGAALQADNLTSNNHEDMLLLDVTPLSLGLETVGSLVEKIIYRNTPIPISRAQEFTTFKDKQNAMDIHILQGERDTVAGCRSLAKFKLSGIPAMPAGAARILVVFSIDADGILVVKAIEQTTGKEQQVDVVPSYGINQQQIVEMIKNSMTHAKDDVEQRALSEAQLELERVCDACQSALNAELPKITDPEEVKGYNQSIEAARCFLHMPDIDEVNHAKEMLEDTFRDLSENMVNSALKDAIVGKKIAK